MQIVVLADGLQKEILIGDNSNESIVWIEDEQEFLQYKNADAFIDLEFVNDEKRKTFLRQLLPQPVVINSVTDTLSETDESFVRIKASAGF